MKLLKSRFDSCISKFFENLNEEVVGYVRFLKGAT